MVFSPSPALHRICQLVRLIRNHPDLPQEARGTARRPPQLPHPDLPDPERFVDSSAGGNAISGRASIDSHRKRANSLGKTGS